MPLSDWQDAKEQVRQATDIVDLVGSYLSLRRQGRNFVGLCPWHDDTKPSLQVNPDRQSFKCWPCDIGGDIFSFTMKIENLDFREALEMLADKAGITLAANRPKSPRESQFDRRNLLQAVAWAEKLFHQCLLHSPEAEPAREYLRERGISEESIARFHLGFAPARWDWLLKQSTEWSPPVLERVGLVVRRQKGEGFYDRFRGRLMFSIRDARSRPIAFGGRVLPNLGGDAVLPDAAKYINSPETPLFNKSSQLYALDLARDGLTSESGIVVMEGYTDVIMAHQHGITNTVAVLGTALGEKHVPVVRRFTDSITLVLDGDTAGQQRTMQILDDLLALFVEKEINLKILPLPEGADPCDVIASQGCDAFRRSLSTAVDALEHKIQTVTNGLAPESGTHRTAQAVEDILGTLARAFPRGASGNSTALVREQQILSRVARRFGMSEDAVRTQLTARRREQASRQRVNAFRRPQESSELPSQSTPLKLKAWEEELLELLLHSPDVLAQLSESLTPAEISNEFCRDVYQHSLALMHEGQLPTFDQLILRTDDPAEKNLLVRCDERGREKSSSNRDQRVKDLLAWIVRQKQDARHQEQLAQLKQNRLDPRHEKELLAELFQNLKSRQAGSSPTEG